MGGIAQTLLERNRFFLTQTHINQHSSLGLTVEKTLFQCVETEHYHDAHQQKEECGGYEVEQRQSRQLGHIHLNAPESQISPHYAKKKQILSCNSQAYAAYIMKCGIAHYGAVCTHHNEHQQRHQSRRNNPYKRRNESECTFIEHLDKKQYTTRSYGGNRNIASQNSPCIHILLYDPFEQLNLHLLYFYHHKKFRISTNRQCVYLIKIIRKANHCKVTSFLPIKQMPGKYRVS